MNRILIFVCLLGSISAFQAFRGERELPWVVSKRDEDVKVITVAELIAEVEETLTNATKGISGADLGAAAARIQEGVIEYLDSKGVQVAKADVEKLVQETATKLNIETAVVNLFENPLAIEANVLDICLQLWVGLVHRVRERQAADQSVDVELAAIAAVATPIQTSIIKADGILTFIALLDQNNDETKRDLAEHFLNKRAFMTCVLSCRCKYCNLGNRHFSNNNERCGTYVINAESSMKYPDC